MNIDDRVIVVIKNMKVRLQVKMARHSSIKMIVMLAALLVGAGVLVAIVGSSALTSAASHHRSLSSARVAGYSSPSLATYSTSTSRPCPFQFLINSDEALITRIESTPSNSAPPPSSPSYRYGFSRAQQLKWTKGIVARLQRICYRDEHPPIRPVAPPHLAPTIPPNARRVGIQTMRQNPLGSSFDGQNFWMGPVQGSVWDLVYAGSIGSTGNGRGQGALYIEKEGRQPDRQFWINAVGLFKAPGIYSPLTVTGWSGTTLQLRADSGQVLSFNLITDSYS